MHEIEELDRSILELRDELARVKPRLVDRMARERALREELSQADREVEEARRELHRLGDRLEDAKRKRNQLIASLKRRP